MKRAVAILLCFVLVAGLFSGCRRSTVSALYFSVSGSASSFDPQIASGDAVRIVVRNCFEGLVSVDEAGNILPAAAQSWTVSEDGTEYTFTLRSDAVWHVSDTAKSGLADKLPDAFAPKVTAADFVFALQRAVDPATGAPDAARLSNIAGAKDIMEGKAHRETLGVRSVGSTRLIITLEHPEPGILETLAEPLCMPCNKTFFEASGGRYGLLMRYIISNGPFYLTRFDDNAFRMARNPDYTGSRTAKTDVIWLYSGESESAVLTKLTDRDYDGACLPEQTALNAGVKKANVTGAEDVLRGFIFNCGNADLAEPSIRKAFFAAAEPSVLADAFGKETADALCPAALSPKTPYRLYYSEVRATALLNKGLETLEKTSVSFTLLCEEQYDAAMRRFLQTWQRVFGVQCSVELESVTAETLQKRVLSGDYDIAFYPVRAESFSAADYFARFSAADAQSLCAWESGDYDAAVRDLRFASGGGDDAQKAVEKLLNDAAVFLPVWQESTCVLCVSGVEGVMLLPGADRLYLYNAYQQ